MKGMIQKDLYLSWKYYKPYFLISIFFIVLSFWTVKNVFMLTYPLMLIGMIPMDLQRVDEAFKWDAYSGSLPCTKKQIVSEKYIIGLMFTVPVTALMLLTNALDMALGGDFQWRVLGSMALIAWMMGFFTSAISLPLIFKFGSEKGRIAQYLIIGACIALSTVMGLRSGGEMPAFSGSAGALLGMLLIPLGLYIGSWFLSICFYEKREIW